MTEQLLLIGAGGHARSCIDVIEQTGKFRIVGLVANTNEIGKKILGYEVIADESGLPELQKKIPRLHIAIGQIKTADNRVRLFREAVSMHFMLPAIISPLAHVSAHATVGAGSIVMHQAMINAAASIGENCIINTKALLEHDVTVGNYCHISTGVTINGGTCIGAGTFVGSGSVIREGVNIAENCIIPMGSRVFHDLAAGTIFNADAVQ